MIPSETNVRSWLWEKRKSDHVIWGQPMRGEEVHKSRPADSWVGISFPKLTSLTSKTKWIARKGFVLGLLPTYRQPGEILSVFPRKIFQKSRLITTTRTSLGGARLTVILNYRQQGLKSCWFEAGDYFILLSSWLSNKAKFHWTWHLPVTVYSRSDQSLSTCTWSR